MMGDCVIGVDAGGTMTKAALFDLKGQEKACARSRNVTTFPHAGWTERDPDGMWRAAAEAIRSVLEESGTDPGDVAAISVSGFGSGLFLIDADGAPTRPGIVSTDGRTGPLLAEWAEDGRAAEIAPLIQQAPWPGMSLTLMAWLSRHEPEVVARTHAVVFCKDFLRGRLCGDFSTDPTDAGSSGLLEVGAGTYSEETLKTLGMAEWLTKLPGIGPSHGITGTVTAEAAALTGLREGTPVVRGTVDMSASAMASMITRPDQMSVVAGTFSIAATLHSDRPKTDAMPMLQFAYPLGGYLSVDGSATSASNLEWVVKTLLKHGDALEMTGDVYDTVNAAVKRAMGRRTDTMFFSYLFGGPAGAPAGLVGMTADTSFDEVMMAIFEGIVFAHKADVDQNLSGAHAARPDVIRLTGGASRSPYWSEMFADILGLPVEVPTGSEFGALGTAMCAATGAGAYGSLAEAVENMASLSRRHEVNAARGALSLAKYPRFCALRDAMAGAMMAEPAHA
jgi:L-xylulokinase